MNTLRWINVALRGIRKAGIITGLAYCGYYYGETMSLKILLAVILPILVFGSWGLIDFRHIGPKAEYLWLTQELIIRLGVAVIVFLLGFQMPAFL